MTLRIHHRLPFSRANGPGARAVIWVQGCSLACAGCFNPETHESDRGKLTSVASLCEWIADLGQTIQGVTISGGEPLQQLEPVTHLVRRIKMETKHSVVLFTGFTWAEIARMGTGEPLSEKSSAGFSEVGRPTHGHNFVRLEILHYLDVLIAGRYDRTKRVARGLRGSENKSLHFLSSRYNLSDLESVPEAEVLVSPAGGLIMSGIDPLRW